MLKAKNLLQVVFTILLLITPAINSKASISGTVTDKDGNPLMGVTVATNITGNGTISNEMGQFSLDKIEDVNRLTFSSVGYKSVQYLADNLPDKIVLHRAYYHIGDILVTADRAEKGITPIAFENLSSDEIERDYTVGEFPLLLSSTPNLYSFSDAGSALGYSYIRIRGFDDKRIVTYINGVPLNDPEDHATYFVDLPDFAANVSDIQIQRGVGNSLYGDASFGGSINIVTSAFDKAKNTSLSFGYGEYSIAGSEASDIYKQSLSFSSGLIDGRWAYSGRFSKQKTGGYRYNSWYEGWAYYFSVGRIDPNMTTELYVYGGPIRMHLSYWGSPREEIEKDRRHNPLTYSNETDNFNQPHYHFHNVYRINERTTLSNTLYYIRGKGYYEQLKTDSLLYRDYNLQDLSDSTSGDLVRQQWVEKNQYGWNPLLEIEHEKGKHSIGASVYSFDSDHWGQVVWAQFLDNSSNPRLKYYQYFGKKNVASFFIQEYYNLNEKLSLQSTAQIRYQRYQLDQSQIGAFNGYNYDVDWVFFSPRFGVNYKVDENVSVYGNFSIASRTPSDVAIYDANDPNTVPSLDADGNPTAKSERVYDFEAGSFYTNSNISLSLNLFYMNFKDEIIPEGGINESGIAYTTNADRSVHSGVEFSFGYSFIEFLTVSGNASYNYNRIKEYIGVIDGIAVDFKDKTIPLFPEYIANIIGDWNKNSFRLTFKSQFFGKQYMELFNDEDLSIKAFSISSLSVSYTFNKFLSMGDMTLKGRLDNLFNKKYEASGYGGNYAYNDGTNDIVGSWAEYYVAPERSFFIQMRMEMF